MKFLLFDTETTGLPKNKNGRIDDSDNWPYIVQLSWILYDDVDNVITLSNDIVKLKNIQELTETSIKIHGITQEKSINTGKPIKEVILNFQTALSVTDVVIAHNLFFDKRIVMAECSRNKMRHEFYNSKQYYCTMKNSVNICKIKTISKTGEEYYKYPKLEQLHEHLFNKKPYGTHDALVDVLICLRCYCKIEHNYDIFTRNEKINTLMKELCKL